MGKQSKGVSGALSGAAAGSAILPGWGTAIGAGLGFLAGESTGGEAPQQVAPIDPAFMNSLYNQSMGTEKTAADMKLKAAFDQTLAQQVAAARAARGVNPGLLQRNVSRLAAEQGAKAAGVMAEANLQNQDNARARYLQALSLNQTAERANIENTRIADDRDQKQLGSLINSVGAIGATYSAADAANKKVDTSGENAVKEPINTSGLTLRGEAPTAQALNNQYTLGAKQEVPQYLEDAFSASSKSDKYSKTKVKRESDLVVVSDERQKDLIKNESLPQNGNLQMQNQQAMQPQGGAQVPPMAAFAQPAAAPMAAPQQAPAAAPASPAPMPASQTALGQANTSLSKGGNLDDLQLTSQQLQAPSEGPSQAEILQMSTDAQRRQKRDIFGNVVQSDKDNYAANLQRWYAKQATDRAAFSKEQGEVGAANQNINAERTARLSQFYTGNSNTNTNDIAKRYAPKTTMQATDWQPAQDSQRAQGVGDQSSGFNYGQVVRPALAFTGARAFSDERSKDEIAPQSKINSGSMNPKNFLDKLSAYSYEYKEGMKNKPNAGDGRYLGVMAQELEKAGPVGKSMVQTSPDGMKQVDYGKGMGTILAAQIQLNERLKAIEAKKGKV